MTSSPAPTRKRKPGAGRKPKPATLLRRTLAERGVEEAEKSFQFLCETRDNSDQPIAVRVECAKTVLDRVLGKATQPIQMAWKEEARKHGVDPDALVAQFVAAMGAGAGSGGGLAAIEATDADLDDPA